MTTNGNRRVISVANAPEWVRKMAGGTTEVVEYTNPDGGKVYRFLIDGEETNLPPVTVGR